MKNNLQAELEWFAQNEEDAKNSGFLYALDKACRAISNKDLALNEAAIDVQGVCVSFSELRADNMAKLSHQTTSTTGVSISKMSFLSNLETRLYKHIPHTKPACGQGPYGQPQSKNTYTSTTATLLASSKSSAQIMSSSAHNRSAAPGLDVSISDEAFLDLDLDSIQSGPPKAASRPAALAFCPSTNTTYHQQQQHRPQPPNQQQYQPGSYKPSTSVPSTSYVASSTSYPPPPRQQQCMAPVNRGVGEDDDDDDEVAELERQAREAVAKLARAKAARLSVGSVGSSSNNTRHFSGWESTPAEVQRRATSSTLVSHTRHDGSSSSSYNSYSNYESLSGGGGGVDYNQNVDYCNVPKSSLMEANMLTDSSYDMRGGSGDHGFGLAVPLCQCGLPCVSLTSRTAANMDRVFFKCSQHKDSGAQCSFFEWADGEGNGSSAQAGGAGGALQPDKDFMAENKRIFGHNTFREGQRECIEAALAGRDVFCLMPTGGGKSLVYQLPAWCCPGLAVVFSPLISLIQDQVEALITVGINAAYFSASRNEADNAAVFDDLYHICTGRDGGGKRVTDYFGNGVEGGGGGSQEGPIKLLYLTPEKFKNSPKMKNMLRRLYDAGKLSRFVIDEAHCLSEWGHDFRPDYISLRELKSEFPATPVMALTATANKTVADDCIRILRLSNPYRHTHSFNRPNITYTVKRKDKKVMDEIGKIVSKRQMQTGIVYCFSKKDTEKVCEDLKKAVPALKNKITFYHADVAPHDKERRQHLWSQGDIKVICATIAFGMGINKPDVRYVIHYSMPKSLTNYYQESGRAGRDGGLSESIVFYSYADKQRLCGLAQKGNEGIEGAGGGGYGNKKAAAVDRALRNICEVTSYCMNRLDCRRSLVLRYFGEEFNREQCRNTCDNCAEKGGWEECNYEVQGRAVLAVMRGLSALGLKDLTLVQLKQLVTNSKDKKLDRYREGLERRGVDVVVRHVVKGKHVVMTKDGCDALLQTMVVNKFLAEIAQVTMAGFSAEYVHLGPEAAALEAGTSPLTICLPVTGGGQQLASTSTLCSHLMNDDQLLDEQFLSFDMDAAVAGAGRGQKRKGLAESAGTIGGAGGVVGEGVGGGAGVLVRQNKKMKKKGSSPPSSMLSTSKTSKQRTYELSDSSDDEGGARMDHGHHSDIEQDDGEDDGWLMGDRGGDIRSRNKGKAQKGALLSLHRKAGAVRPSASASASAAVRKKSVTADDMDIEIDITSPASVSSVSLSGKSLHGGLEREEEEEEQEEKKEVWRLSRRQQSELREWLYAFRKRYHNYWVVLNNNSVHDIVMKLPLSKKELSSVSGLGENKVRLHGDLIIATTWAFLHSHGLLSHVPAMVRGGFLNSPPVTLAPRDADCPSWKNPQSAEGQEVQARMKEARESAKESKKAAAAAAAPTADQVTSFPSSSPHFASKSGAGHTSTPQHQSLHSSTPSSTFSQRQQYQRQKEIVSPESPSLLAGENHHQGQGSFLFPPSQKQQQNYSYRSHVPTQYSTGVARGGGAGKGRDGSGGGGGGEGALR